MPIEGTYDTMAMIIDTFIFQIAGQITVSVTVTQNSGGVLT